MVLTFRLESGRKTLYVFHSMAGGKLYEVHGLENISNKRASKLFLFRYLLIFDYSLKRPVTSVIFILLIF